MCMPFEFSRSFTNMAEAESIRWLKSKYTVGPPTKKVKFSKIHDELAHHFADTDFNSLAVSQTIKEAFPSTKSKPYGKANHRYVFGLQEQGSTQFATHASISSNPELVAMLEQERTRSRELEARLIEKERRVHDLEMRVLELDTATFTTATLEAQMEGVMNPRLQIYHGPDSIAHLGEFSVKQMIDEVNRQAPDVLHLLSMLGRAPSLVTEPEVSDMQAVSALCALAKGRCEKVLGIQLLIGLMLIARSTHRQVSIFNKLTIQTRINNYTTQYYRQ